MSDLLGIALTITWVFVFLIGTEIFSRTGKISKEAARKIIHIAVGHVIFFIPLYETKWIAAGVPFLFVFGNLMLSPVSPIEKLRLETFKAGHTWGTVLYPLSLSIVTWFGFDNPYLIILAFFPVIYGDGLAAIFGPKYPIKEYELHNGTKSIGGTLTVLIASFVSIILASLLMNLFYSNNIWDSGLLLTYAAFAAVIATAVEFMSLRGTDNFLIPIALISFFLII